MKNIRGRGSNVLLFMGHILMGSRQFERVIKPYPAHVFQKNKLHCTRQKWTLVFSGSKAANKCSHRRPARLDLANVDMIFLRKNYPNTNSPVKISIFPGLNRNIQNWSKWNVQGIETSTLCDMFLLFLCTVKPAGVYKEKIMVDGSTLQPMRYVIDPPCQQVEEPHIKLNRFFTAMIVDMWRWSIHDINN